MRVSFEHLEDPVVCDAGDFQRIEAQLEEPAGRFMAQVMEG